MVNIQYNSNYSAQLQKRRIIILLNSKGLQRRKPRIIRMHVSIKNDVF